MKFTVERDVLAEAVTWTARSLPSSPAVPVLAGVLIEATGTGTLVLSGFDYETSARIEIPAEVHEPGEILVYGRLLADIARSLPAKPVVFNQDGNRVSVICGSSKFNLMSMPIGEYPDRPAMPEAAGTIPADVFAQAVSQVSLAASRDDTLAIFTGVRMEIEGDRLTLLATDRYRLALRTLNWNAAVPEADTTALVRARTLSDVAKTIGSGGDVTLALNAAEGSQRGRIGFEAGGRQMTSSLVDGQYPKVRSIFPKETTIHAVVEVGPLLEAVRRVSLVAEQRTPVRLSFTDGLVELEAGGNDGEATESLEANLDGEEISIRFNPHYLLDGLGALSHKFVRLSFTAADKAAVLTGQREMDGPDDEDYQYLVMPFNR